MCLAKDAVDCGPEVKDTCHAGTSCFTPTTDQLEGYEEGKTYCLKPEQLAKVRDDLEDVADSLREKLTKRRADRKRKREEEKQEVAGLTKEAKERKQRVQEEERQAKQQRREADKRRASASPAKDNAHRSLSSEGKELKEARREVVGLQDELKKAGDRRARKTERARQEWRGANEDFLQLAGKWNKAHADGKTAEAKQLHRRLLDRKKRSDEKYAAYEQLKARKVDPKEAARIQKKINKANERVATLEKKRSSSGEQKVAQQRSTAVDAGAGRSGESPKRPDVISDNRKSQNKTARPQRKASDPARRRVSSRPSESKNQRSSSSSDKRQLQARHSTNANRLQPSTRRGQIASKKTPVQFAMEKELLRQYGDDKSTIKKVANHADYASLAAAAYHPKEKFNVAGWKRLYTLPYENDKTGSNEASVFRSERTGAIVVAFQGTNEISDNRTNLRSGIPAIDGDVGKFTPTFESGQVDWVKNTARAISKKYGRNVTFVGHSLGGRLAQVARIETGANAVVFDSAPLSPSEKIRAMNLTRGDRKLGALEGFRSPGDQISILSSGRDIEVKNFVPYDEKSLLTRSAFEHYYGTFGHDHSIDALAQAMQTVKNVDSWMD